MYFWIMNKIIFSSDIKVLVPTVIIINLSRLKIQTIIV